VEGGSAEVPELLCCRIDSMRVWGWAIRMGADAVDDMSIPGMFWAKAGRPGSAKHAVAKASRR
jgi:hypothetical protein